MSRQRGGYGLIEVLIALALASLLTLLLHRFLVAILHASSKNAVQVHLSRQANNLATRLERDLKATDGSGLSYLRDPAVTAIAICRGNGLEPNGLRLYEQKLRVYFWKPESKQVRYLELEAADLPGTVVADVTQAIHLEPDELLVLLSGEPASKLVAASVIEFLPLQDWPPQPLTKLLVRLEQNTAGAGQRATYELVREIAFR